MRKAPRRRGFILASTVLGLAVLISGCSTGWTVHIPVPPVGFEWESDDWLVRHIGEARIVLHHGRAETVGVVEVLYRAVGDRPESHGWQAVRVYTTQDLRYAVALRTLCDGQIAGAADCDSERAYMWWFAEPVAWLFGASEHWGRDIRLSEGPLPAGRHDGGSPGWHWWKEGGVVRAAPKGDWKTPRVGAEDLFKPGVLAFSPASAAPAIVTLTPSETSGSEIVFQIGPSVPTNTVLELRHEIPLPTPQIRSDHLPFESTSDYYPFPFGEAIQAIREHAGHDLDQAFVPWGGITGEGAVSVGLGELLPLVPDPLLEDNSWHWRIYLKTESSAASGFEVAKHRDALGQVSYEAAGLSDAHLFDDRNVPALTPRVPLDAGWTAAATLFPAELVDGVVISDRLAQLVPGNVTYDYSMIPEGEEPDSGSVVPYAIAFEAATGHLFLVNHSPSRIKALFILDEP